MNNDAKKAATPAESWEQWERVQCGDWYDVSHSDSFYAGFDAGYDHARSEMQALATAHKALRPTGSDAVKEIIEKIEALPDDGVVECLHEDVAGHKVITLCDSPDLKALATAHKALREKAAALEGALISTLVRVSTMRKLSKAEYAFVTEPGKAVLPELEGKYGNI